MKETEVVAANGAGLSRRYFFYGLMDLGGIRQGIS